MKRSWAHSSPFAFSPRPLRALRLWTLALAGAALSAAAQDERALMRLWARQMAQPTHHADMAAACAAFKSQSPGDAFAPLADQLAAWHLLMQGQTEQASALWAAGLAEPINPLQQGTVLLARAWLTRLDREQVRGALQFFYRKEIRYPRSLVELSNYQALPDDRKPPDRDRWGAFWQYRLVGFKTMPGLEDQKYELLSSRLGEGSDLKAARSRPYGDGIRVQPIRVVSTTIPGREVVEVLREAAGPGQPESRLLLTAGMEDQPLYLAHIGPLLIVLCDTYHWAAFPRPPDP